MHWLNSSFQMGIAHLQKYFRSARRFLQNDEDEFHVFRPVTQVTNTTPLSIQRRYLSNVLYQNGKPITSDIRHQFVTNRLNFEAWVVAPVFLYG